MGVGITFTFNKYHLSQCLGLLAERKVAWRGGSNRKLNNINLPFVGQRWPNIGTSEKFLWMVFFKSTVTMAKYLVDPGSATSCHLGKVFCLFVTQLHQ